MQEYKGTNGITNSKMGEFITKVCEQIRWKKTHNSISEELLNHMEDQKEAFVRRGQKEEEAEKNAILQMGDAVAVGQQLDRTHRPNPDWGVFILVFLCVLVSVALRYFISLNNGENGGQAIGYFYSYLKVLPFGMAAMIGMYFADYSLIGKYPKSLYGVALAVTLLLFNFAPQLNYVYIHVFYCAVLLIPLYAGFVYSQRGKGYLGLVYCGAVGVISCIVFEWGPSIVSVWMFSISGAVILTAGIKKDWFQVRKKYALGLVWGPVLFVIMAPFILCFRRFKCMFSTEGDEYGYSYVLKMIREFLSNSKLLGRGDLPSFITQENFDVVNGRGIEGVLPSWQNDYCLTYMIHKFGWFTAVMVIALVVFLLIRLYKIVNKQSSQLGYIVALGVAMTIVSQCIIFLLANLGICGWHSHPLPLISPGDISLIVNMGLMGLILSVYRNNSIVRDRIIQIKSVGNFNGSNVEQHSLQLGKWQLTIRKL